MIRGFSRSFSQGWNDQEFNNGGIPRTVPDDEWEDVKKTGALVSTFPSAARNINLCSHHLSTVT